MAATILAEREKAEKEYFTRLIEGHVLRANHTPSPIESVFRTHLRDSLAANEMLYQELLRGLLQTKEQLAQAGRQIGAIDMTPAIAHSYLRNTRA